MLTNLDILDLIIRLYDNKIGAMPNEWDWLCTVDGSYCVIKIVDGTAVVLWRGSVTPLDWFQDFQHVAIACQDPTLGGVHSGFLTGVRQSQDLVDGALQALAPDAPIIVAGHSLGAGHAILYAAHRTVIGRSAQRLTLFGAPRAGYQKLSDLIGHVDCFNYRNCGPGGHDLVTDVPFTLPNFPYVQPRQFIDVSAPPPKDDRWGPLSWHHIVLYRAGLVDHLNKL